MPVLKQRLSKRTKIQISLAVAVVFLTIVLLVVDVFLHGPITTFLTNKDLIVDRINSFGALAPIAFLIFSTIETVVAPVPGQIVSFTGGFLFGWWGVPLNFIATGLGCFIIFWLSRRFGRPFVEKIIKKQTLDKFDYLTKEKGSLAFFLIFLIPGLPDDIVCYIAGLTEIPISRLMAIVLLGRLPSIVMTNFIGAGLGEDDITPVVIASTATVILLAIIFIKREKILALITARQQKNND